MLVLGSGCKYRLSLAERFDCTETIINELLADAYQNPISEWQVETSSGLPPILHYGELYNYFIIYYNVIIIEIKCTINVMRVNHPETIPPPWSVEKLSSMKPVPGAKKVGDRCSTWAVRKAGIIHANPCPCVPLSLGRESLIFSTFTIGKVYDNNNNHQTPRAYNMQVNVLCI